MAVTSDTFIEGVKRRVTIPASEVLLTNNDILAFADSVTRSKVVPLIKSVREDFFVTIKNTPIVADQTTYDIPPRALGRGLRDLKLIDGSGNKRQMTLIAIEDEHLWRTGTVACGFYFYGDKIALVPTPNDTTFTLEIWWELPPSLLVQNADAGRVTSFTATTVSFASIPSTFQAGTIIDFIQGVSGNSVISMDQTITNVSSTTITFAADVIPASLAVGDYVSLAETSPVLQIPNEATPYLETLTAMRVLNAVGDFDGLARLKEDEKDEATALKQVLEPRAEGEPTKIVNRRGLLRSFRGNLLSGSGFFY